MSARALGIDLGTSGLRVAALALGPLRRERREQRAQDGLRPRGARLARLARRDGTPDGSAARGRARAHGTGRVTAEAACRLKVPMGATVVAGLTDGCASFLATGADRPGDGVSALGTTLTLKLLSDGPVFAPDHGVYSHRIGALWLVGGGSNTGGGVLATLFAPDALDALSARIDPSVPSGLDYYPLRKPGERFPINEPGLAPRLSPRPADEAAFLHGVLEGMARIEAEGYARLAALGAPPLARLFTTGGGARNAAWSAIRGRLMGSPLAAPTSDGAAVGVAQIALGALAA